MITTDALATLEPKALIALILELSSAMEVLKAEIETLKTENALLRSRLNKNSSNSSNPPSSDGFRKPPKPKSLRGKSGKKSGGQAGHLGETLKQVKHPDKRIVHGVTDCIACGKDISKVKSKAGERRQVFDVPKPTLEVTEHISAVVCCPHCHAISKGLFPDDVTAPVQYGARAKAIAQYYRHDQYMAEDRTARCMADIHGLTFCAATVGNGSHALYTNLAPHEHSAEQHLINSKLVHFDETGMRVQKELYWLHSASTSLTTVYKIHQKRGVDAMKNFPVHQQFKGIAAHDHWKPYFKLHAAEHALCNAHILRELIGLAEESGAIWAKAMERLLLECHQQVKQHQEKKSLPTECLKTLDDAYDLILHQATRYYDEIQRPSGKSPPGEALFVRLTHYKKDITRFMHDFEVPFSNNQAEQDIRMCKVRQKISGCFRAPIGAEIFCRIRGFISTTRKHGFNVIDAITDAINGNPFLLPA